MGHARFTYRARVSATAERALLCEWGRCRWVWNQCVAESRQPWKEKRECGPSSVRVYQDALGHWYVSFVVESEAEPYPETGKVIGIDWGHARRAALSCRGTRTAPP